MKIEFLAIVAVIAPDPPASRELYVDMLGLPLESRGGSREDETALRRRREFLADRVDLAAPRST